jgi:DNA-binding NtrC family response regulator
VRQLRNAVEYAFVCSRGAVLERPNLPPEILAWKGFIPARHEESEVAIAVPPPPRTRKKRTPRAANDRDQLLELLQRFRGNRSRVAEELGVGRTTLWRKLRELGIEESYR